MSLFNLKKVISSLMDEIDKIHYYRNENKLNFIFNMFHLQYYVTEIGSDNAITTLHQTKE